MTICNLDHLVPKTKKSKTKRKFRGFHLKKKRKEKANN